MDTTLVSVLMPVYNAEKYLSKALQSILNQSFKDFEFIIIDDGSTDDSLKIIQSFKDERIKIIQNDKNLGLIKTLNKGIHLAKGKYIARMDADDIAMPKRLEKQVAFLEKNVEITIVGTKAMVINEVSKPSGLIIDVPTKHEEIKTQILLKCPFIHPSIMGRRSIFNDFLYDENFPIAEDFHLWVKIVEQYRVANIDEILLKYRVHQNNVSNNIKKFEKKIDSLKKIFFLQFSKLDFPINDFQLKNHLEFCSIVFDNCKKDMKDVRRVYVWAETLKKENKVQQWFNSDLFEQYLADAWYGFCTRNILHLGIKGFIYFWNSKLRNQVSTKKTILLFLHTLGNFPMIYPFYKVLKNKLLPFITLKN